MFPLHYCYFSFRHAGNQHDLRVWITPALSMEWKLYINDHEVGTLIDEITNVLIEAQLNAALSYSNVQRVYSELLTGPPVGK